MWYKLKNVYDYIRYDIPRGIKNLIIWLPAVWKDRQWDHQFIYMILRHKLNLQQQFIREHGVHVNNVQDADEIKECVELLDNLIEDDYHSKAFEAHDKRWGAAEMNWVDASEHGDDMVQLKITHPKVVTDEDHANERVDFLEACEREDYLRKSDLRLLFDIMRKKIQGWWD